MLYCSKAGIIVSNQDCRRKPGYVVLMGKKHIAGNVWRYRMDGITNSAEFDAKRLIRHLFSGEAAHFYGSK